MPQYSKTTWIDGTAPAISAANLNKLEQGVFDSIRQDGSTTMSAQLVTIAGTAATPAIAPTGDSNTGIFFPAADTIAFAEGGAEAMRIDSNGYVAIGATSAGAAKLRVEDANSAKIYSVRTGGATLLIEGGSASGFVKTITNSNLNLGANNTDYMTITSTGNVGIGTISPSTELHVKGAGEILRLETTAASGAGSNYLSFHDTSGEKATLGYVVSDDTFYILNKKNSSMQFRTNNSDRMTITSTGNVGIGTTAPNDKLEVSGGIRRTQVTAGSTVSPASEIGLQYQYDNSSNRSGLYFHNTYSNNGAAWMSFWTSNTSNVFSEKMRITELGNVGIGTTSPDVGSTGNKALTVTGVFTRARLQLQNTDGGINAVAGTVQFLNSSSSLGDITMTSDSGSGTTGFMAFTTNANERMRITAAGNVGIGVVPNAELHVKGTGEIFRLETTAATGDNFIRFYAPSAVTKGFVGYTSSGSNNLVVNNALSADVWIGTNNIDRLYVEAGGTTRPAANNTYDLGSSGFRWATIYAQNALNTSDARLKTDVAPSSLGLDFIASLNPVQYRWIEGGNSVDKVQTGTETVEITPTIPAQPEVLDEEGNVIQEATEEVAAVTEERPVYETVVTPREGVRTHFGLIAQEVKAALPDGLDFGGWALADKEDADSTQFLGYMELIAPMIKAIQELNAKVEALEAQLAK